VNNKWWSFLFGATMLACLGLFIVAPFVGWWLPKNVSSYGDKVDGLFYLILGITGFFFVLTEFLLVYFMYEYAGSPTRKEHLVGHHYAEKKVFWTSFFKSAFRPVSALLHDQHRVELAWTIVPAGILLYIAFAQINAWAEIKDPANMPAKPDLALEVSARMFEWRLRYPKPEEAGDGAAMARWLKSHTDVQAKGEIDDIHVVNEVHVWQGAKVKVLLKSRDVIHSFYLPNLRLKQDALPGKTIPVWFEVTEYNTVPAVWTGKAWKKVDPRGAGVDLRKVHWVDGYDPASKEFDPAHQTWELACAELCGWGHFKMRGKLYVHGTQEDFNLWLQQAKEKQNTTRLTADDQHLER
jgi:cytochrome c oxidase subunit 2